MRAFLRISNLGLGLWSIALVVAFIVGWRRASVEPRHNDTGSVVGQIESVVGEDGWRPDLDVAIQPPAIGSSLDVIFAERSGPQRRLALHELIDRADEATVVRLLSEAGQLLPGFRRDEVVDVLFHRWGELAPERALVAVDGLRASEQARRRAMVIEGWVGTDADGAFAGLLAYRRAHPFESSMEYRLTDAFQRPLLERGEYGRLAAFAVQFADRAWTSAFCSSLAKEWAASDPAALVAWIGSLPEGAARASARSVACLSLGGEFGDLAVELALSSGDARERGRSLRSAVSSWGQAAPDAASACVRAMPAGSDRDAALEGLIAGLGWSTDAATFVSLLELGSDGGVRSRLAEQLARDCSGSRPEIAIDVTLRYLTGNSRTEVLGNAYSCLARRDADAAQQALAGQSGLSEAERREIEIVMMHGLTPKPGR